MIYTTQQGRAFGAPHRGASCPCGFVFCANHCKTGIHPKWVYTNESAALDGANDWCWCIPDGPQILPLPAVVLVATIVLLVLLHQYIASTLLVYNWHGGIAAAPQTTNEDQ
jgi:hypothetical protein